MFFRTNLETQVGTPLDIGNADLLIRIDHCQIEQSGVVSRSVWVVNGHEVFGIGRQVGEMYVSFGSARSSSLGRIFVFSTTSDFIDGWLSRVGKVWEKRYEHQSCLSFHLETLSAYLYPLFEARY